MKACEMCSEPATIHCEWMVDLSDHPDDVARQEELHQKGSKQKIKIRLIPPSRWIPELQEADLCSDHSTELWLQCASAVNAGYCHWTNKPIIQCQTNQ